MDLASGTTPIAEKVVVSTIMETVRYKLSCLLARCKVERLITDYLNDENDFIEYGRNNKVESVKRWFVWRKVGSCPAVFPRGCKNPGGFTGA